MEVNHAYDILIDPRDREEYNKFWDERDGSKSANVGSIYANDSSINPPKPTVDPPYIRISDAEAGETKNSFFIIRNAGGPYNKLWFSTPDSWVQVVNWSSVSNDQLPLRVEIEANGKDWNKSYLEYINVKLDEAETTVKVELRTKHNPVNPQPVANPIQPKGRLSYYIAIGIIMILLFYNYGYIMTIFFGSHVIAPSAIDGPKISHTETVTAYTRDGINFVSKERVDENIKYEYAKPGDYREVQVPLNTIVVGASIIPSET